MENLNIIIIIRVRIVMEANFDFFLDFLSFLVFKKVLDLNFGETKIRTNKSHSKQIHLFFIKGTKTKIEKKKIFKIEISHFFED